MNIVMKKNLSRRDDSARSRRHDGAAAAGQHGAGVRRPRARRRSLRRAWGCSMPRTARRCRTGCPRATGADFRTVADPRPAGAISRQLVRAEPPVQRRRRRRRRRRSRAVVRALADGHPHQEDRGRRYPGRRVDGSGRGEAPGQGDAAVVVRAVARQRRVARRLRFRLQLRVYQHAGLARRAHAAADRSATRARCSSGCSAPPRAPTPPRGWRVSRRRRAFSTRRSRASPASSGRSARSDQLRVDQYLDSVREAERRIQTAEGQSKRELPVVERSRRRSRTVSRITAG